MPQPQPAIIANKGGQITLLSAADYTNNQGKLVHAKAGDVITDCCAVDLADLRSAGIVVELDEAQQAAVEVLRKMPDDKRALVRAALGV